MPLEKIVMTKRQEIEVLRQQKNHGDVNRSMSDRVGRRSLATSLRQSTFGLIAEIKPASPSKGMICEHVDAVSIAQNYERGGANAISVLTDRLYFRGSADHLIQVRQHVEIPVLRKDFILDRLQIEESQRMGADAILLIVAILEREQLIELSQYAHQLGLEVLVEIHEQAEIEPALACEADVIGINNRNLKTFHTSLKTTEQLRPLLPADQLVITESGIHSSTDALRMKQAGAVGMLVGEHLMRQANREQAVKDLLGAV